MEQQSSTVTTTEYAADAIELLARVIRYSARRSSATSGTEHLVHVLLDDSEKPGSVLVPGLNKSTSVSGRIMAMDDKHWVHDDAFHGEPVALDAPGEEDNRFEAEAAWREALWLAEGKYARKLPEGTVWPERPSGALGEVLVGAVRLARAEGTYEVHGRHLARAVLDVGDCRAVEAMTLCRVDLAASASALDAQAQAMRDGGKPWWSEVDTNTGSLMMLRQGGLLDERGKWWTRILMSMFSRGGDGSPLLRILTQQAKSQATRHGRDAAEPRDLLMAVLSLDRLLTLAKPSSPAEALRSVGSVADLLRAHGTDHVALVRAVVRDGQDADSPEQDETGLTAASNRLLARTRLFAAERGASSIGAEHLLSVLLSDADGGCARLLRDNGVDLDGVRAGLDRLLGA
ncbi:Clp protease N-terminal domain-containing protein [Streptomyces sp. NBC_01429]|uniref:Clp protease N-terminal domain-containing protein n=1 Tax=Streptomyces sp. NBC_01429 TaxID=2903862 RepID=UPI002E286EE1|nr:Clp protease N-terminal domain-containing protein [Streptomyces sp. NBC_01429]